MIDSKSLEKRFGIDVILQNLSPEEKYLCINKNILNDSSVEKINHIKDSIFADTKSLLNFMSNTLGVDINLCSTKLPICINELFRLLSEYNMINPYFDPENIDTWCEQSDNFFNLCKNCLEENDMLNPLNVMLNEASTVSDERIKENIFNDLDDNSILLLYGLLTGSYPSYNNGMRQTVYNDIKNNREKSRIGDIILHSLKENETEDFGSVINRYGTDTCKMAQMNGTVIIDELGVIKSISKIGDNKYCVDVLNEDNKTLSTEDVEKINLANSITEYKEALAENPSLTPDKYVFECFDAMKEYPEHYKKLMDKFVNRFPELAQKIEKNFGTDFLNK